MKKLIYILLICFLTGCTATSKNAKRSTESPEESIEAMRAVVSAVAGEELTDEELRRLSKEIRTNSDAKSAINSMTGALSGDKPVIKYCPEDGKRYAGHLEYCPGTTIPLKVVE